MNEDGYRNLMKLASVAQTAGFYYKPRIDRKLLAAHHEGLIALSACLHSEVPWLDQPQHDGRGKCYISKKKKIS